MSEKFIRPRAAKTFPKKKDEGKSPIYEKVLQPMCWGHRTRLAGCQDTGVWTHGHSGSRVRGSQHTSPVDSTARGK